jgi:hypothetical protein
LHWLSTAAFWAWNMPCKGSTHRVSQEDSRKRAVVVSACGLCFCWCGYWTPRAALLVPFQIVTTARFHQNASSVRTTCTREPDMMQPRSVRATDLSGIRKARALSWSNESRSSGFESCFHPTCTEMKMWASTCQGCSSSVLLEGR